MKEARENWVKARDSLEAAREMALSHPNSSASRSYYAAFDAIRALFALDGKTFSKHTAIEAAVHRDLVKAGLWSISLGQAYSRLGRLRSQGDYGSPNVSTAEAEEAVALAAAILDAVAKHNPDIFAR